MRNFSRKLVCHLLLLVAATGAPVLRADDLDTLLTQPPSASLSRDDASHRVEMLRAEIPTHSDRKDEIEAYLIPFVRVMQPPPEAPTPTPVPPAARAKPLLLVKSPDGTASTMRAISRRRQGAVVMVMEENGGRAVLQANTIAGELQWFSDPELASGAVDLGGLAASYETFGKAMPALRPSLKKEADRLRTMQQTRDREAAEKNAAIEARVAQATAESYDPSKGYTAAALAKQLLAAEKVRNELPQFAGRIDQWAVPFHEHFAKLLSGHSYLHGQWVSNADLARQAHEKRQAEFLAGLDYQIGTAALSAGAVQALVSPFLFKAGFAILAGIGLLVLGWRRPYIRLAGAGLLAVTPLGVATIFFLATRDPGLMPGTLAMGDEKPVVEALSQAAGLEQAATDAEVISELSLNGFLARHVRISGEENTSASRQAVVVRLLPGRIAIFEMVRGLGLNWVVRIDLAFQTANGSLALVGAKVGAVDCPKEFAADLWRNLEPQLATILSSSRLSERFAVQNPAEGTIALRPIADGAGGDSEPR